MLRDDLVIREEQGFRPGRLTVSVVVRGPFPVPLWERVCAVERRDEVLERAERALNRLAYA